MTLSKKLTALFFIIISQLTIAQENVRPVVTSDLMKLATTSALSISPDGKQAVSREIAFKFLV